MSETGRRIAQALRRSGPCWTLAAALGAAANGIEVPLAWVLGPLLVAAAFSIAGARPVAPLCARRFGQLIVGVAIGLNMTAAAAATLALWLPLMVATALVSILLSATISAPFAHLGRTDARTAYFSMLPGGLSEMANVGASLGARSDAISLSQALRVALAVLLMPPLVLAIGEDGGVPGLERAGDLSYPTVALLIAAGFVGALALKATRLANPWMLGSLIAAGLIAGSGLVEGGMPAPVLWAGQFFIGLAIGVRFKRDIVRRLPRLAAVSAVMTLLLGALLLGVASVIAALTAIDVASSALGASPGGFVEMTLTAQALHLDVTLVTGFHFVRAFLVNSLAVAAWRALDRVGWFTTLQKVFGRPPDDPPAGPCDDR